MNFFRASFTIIVIISFVSCGDDSSTNNGGNGTISNVLEPLSTFSLVGSSGQRMVLESPYLYVGDYDGSLQVIDVSDPENPSMTGYHSSVGNRSASSYRHSPIAKQGSFVFIVTHGAWDEPDSIIIYDVADPASPTIVNVVESNQTGHSSFPYTDFSSVYVDNNTMYVVDHTVIGYNISNIADIQIIDEIQDLNRFATHCMSIYEDYLFQVYIQKDTSLVSQLTVNNKVTRELINYIEVSKGIGTYWGFNYHIEVIYPKAYIWNPFDASATVGNWFAEIDIANPEIPILIQRTVLYPEYELDSKSYPFSLMGIRGNDDYIVLYGSSLLLCDANLNIIKASNPLYRIEREYNEYKYKYHDVCMATSVIYALSDRKLEIFEIPAE